MPWAKTAGWGEGGPRGGVPGGKGHEAARWRSPAPCERPPGSEREARRGTFRTPFREAREEKTPMRVRAGPRKGGPNRGAERREAPGPGAAGDPPLPAPPTPSPTVAPTRPPGKRGLPGA